MAVTDVDTAKGEAFAAGNGVPHDPTLEALLARDEVDVVCVCVPSGLHAEIGLAAAAAGKHLVVEKPIDIHLDAARRLIDGAAAAGVSLNVISQQRYNPGVQRAQSPPRRGRARSRPGHRHQRALVPQPRALTGAPPRAGPGRWTAGGRS